MSEWRPIETAPENTVVLICGHNPQNGDYYVTDAKLVDGTWFLFDINDDAHTCESRGHSHWMPLPEPPQ